MLCQAAIGHLVDAIEHEIDEIESAEQGRGEIDVCRNWQIDVVFTADWIRRSKNTGAGI
jgi:hypothetical protein